MPMRPLRPDDSKGRSSSQVRHVRAVTMTPCTSPLESPDRDTAKVGSAARAFEEPPPLPEKSSQADYANLAIGDESPQISAGSCLVRRGTHKDRVKIVLVAASTMTWWISRLYNTLAALSCIVRTSWGPDTSQDVEYTICTFGCSITCFIQHLEHFLAQQSMC